MKLWSLTTSSPRGLARRAERAERDGWAGLGVTDSQNLAGDAWVALALIAGATERLEFGTSVTNPITRHPAVTAAAAHALSVESGGRVTVGLGRGDSALAHLGRAPASVAHTERYVQVLRRFLRGAPVAFEDLGFSESTAPDVATLGLADTPAASRLVWRADGDPLVSVEVASTGPKVIAAAARSADRIVFALGADPDRLRWGIETARKARVDVGLDPDAFEYATYLNVMCHPDIEKARALVAGGLTTFARFSVMHGAVQGPADEKMRGVMEKLHGVYDMKQHTRADSDQTSALTPEFIDRYAIVGSAETCVARLQEIAELGIGKAILVGATGGVDVAEARKADEHLVGGVLPAFASGA
ncbi:MAG: LLM class flavin-dependent oxidoreductase [bacterium]|nr:LLM class flavin-dependent oxidoreductase [bacterium]